MFGKEIGRAVTDAWTRMQRARPTDGPAPVQRSGHVAAATAVDAVAPAREALRGPFADSLSIASYDPFAAIDAPRFGPAYYGTAEFEELLKPALLDITPKVRFPVVSPPRTQPTRLGDLTPQRVAEMPNAGNAQQVWARLKGFTSPRLSEDSVRLLVLGVADSRGITQQGMLGATSALDAAAALMRMPAQAHGEVTSLLAQAGSDCERVLLLKSLASRKVRLCSMGTESTAEAMAEIRNYAQVIRGKPRDVLELSSTLLKYKLNVLKELELTTLKQQYRNSCVGASVLFCAAEADPVLAWALNAEGRLDRLRPGGLADRLEASILTSDRAGAWSSTWDVPASRPGEAPDLDTLASAAELSKAEARPLLALQTASRLKEVFETLGVPLTEDTMTGRSLVGQLRTAAAWDAFHEGLAHADALFPEEAKALALLKERLGTKVLGPHQSLADVLRSIQRAVHQPNGIDPDHGGTAFLRPFTHLDSNRVKYAYRMVEDLKHPERGVDTEHPNRWAQVVGSGQPTMVRRGDPEDVPENYSHCIVFADVRGEGADRELLRVDSIAGADWVPLDALNGSRSISYYFGHSYPQTGVGRAPSSRGKHGHL